MIDPHNPLGDDELEAYLDGALDAADRAAVEEALAPSPSGAGRSSCRSASTLRSCDCSTSSRRRTTP